MGNVVVSVLSLGFMWLAGWFVWQVIFGLFEKQRPALWSRATPAIVTLKPETIGPRGSVIAGRKLTRWALGASGRESAAARPFRPP